jgi:serine protease inhibitor
MKTALWISIISITCLCISCKKDSNPSAQEKKVELSSKQQLVIDQSNSFGFDFFREVYAASGNDQNLMVSPLSVSMALGMTRNGAAGSTLDAINNTMGLQDMTDTEANESFKYILETFSTLDPRVKMSIANSIWYRNTFNVQQDFINTDKTYFNAEVNAVDFDNPETVNTINTWVSDNTNQLIPKIINGISPDMVMYLINAVYFKGQWKYQFDKAETTDKEFNLTDGSKVMSPSMIQHADLKYFSGEGFEAVELPYNQGNYNMIILLPETGKDVASIIEQLNLNNWNTWYRQFSLKDIQIQLPKFKFAYDEPSMMPVLSNLGMEIAFDPDHADFTRINAGGGLYISEVKHKTYVETNEEGTEAAAVTSIGIAVTSIGEDPVPYDFIVNRPFIFFINEKSSGSVLFIGTVMNPTLE